MFLSLYYLLDEFIFYFRDVRSILSLFLYMMKNLVSNNVNLVNYVASGLGMHCFPFTRLNVRMD